jgi:hypothetical protein
VFLRFRLQLGGGGGGGGGGGPAMKLQNPLKLQRVVVVRSRPPVEQGDRPQRDNNRRGPPGRSSPGGAASTRPVGGIGNDGDQTGGGGDGAAPGDDRRPRRAAPAKPAANQWKKKTSLRIGTGKKGRSAEVNGRRGSLRRRDRSGQKAAKEEAAVLRKTVNLPE